LIFCHPRSRIQGLKKNQDPGSRSASLELFYLYFYLPGLVHLLGTVQDLYFRARRSQLHSLQSRIRELTGQVEERDARLTSLATRLQEANNLKKELAKYKVSAPQPPSPFALQFYSSEGVVNQKHEVRKERGV
jgi:hypothetical protein